jgi:radical SAM protein with 4Fe4S-binding SPASM domain
MITNGLFDVGGLWLDLVGLETYASPLDAPLRRESLRRRLLRKPRGLLVHLIPTWECNLRCRSCFVLGNLKHPSSNLPMPIMVDGIVDFMARHSATYGHRSFHIHLIGGEPMLRIDECLEAIRGIRNAFYETGFSITTNLSIPWTDKMRVLIESVDNVSVSVDGDIESHNSERFRIGGGDGPFVTTVRNIDAARRAGLSGKIKVNAATRPDFYANERRVHIFRCMMLALGVRHVSVVSRAPSYDGSIGDEWFTNMKAHEPSLTQCCAFRLMSTLAIYGDGVFADYHDNDSKIAGLSDAIEDIEAKHIDFILGKMPVLGDQECLECPVLGACWGRCINNAKAQRGKPSDFCDKENLIRIVTDMAGNGRLIRSSQKAAAWLFDGKMKSETIEPR